MDRATERTGFVAVLAFAAWWFDRQALKLQHVETHRRLGDLNHAAETLQTAVNHNVSHDTWTAFIGTYERRHDEIDTKVDDLSRFDNKLVGALALVIVVIPVVVIIIQHYALK